MVTHETTTQREFDEREFEMTMFDKQAAHTQTVKAMELEVAQIEAKWSNVLKLPIIIAKLPLYMILGVAICISVARKHEVPKDLWQLLR